VSASTPASTSARRGAPNALERRPEARPYSIESLLQQVVDGRIRVPAFQRDLRWKVEDAIQLLDSIHKGYPIGTLLFWQRAAESATLRYGSVAIDGPQTTDALWVVDGQQRITSLVRVLLGQGHPTEEFALFFDLSQGCFAHLLPRETAPRHFVPLTEVVDSERLISWLLDHGEGLERGPAISLGKRVREYQVPAYIVRTDDEHAVREIFRRMNSTGKRMEDAEVFTALYGAREGNSPADLRAVSRALAELQFGTLEVGVLHTMLLATLGTDITKNRVPDLTSSEASEAMRRLEQIGRTIITFLRRDAQIRHVALLPYTQPLVTLARFFRYHPEPHPRSRRLLARWIWRGAITGLHRGDSVSTRRNLEFIADDHDEHVTVQALLESVPQRQAKPMTTESFNFRYALSKVQTSALCSLRPRHLETGEVLSVTGSDDGGGLFPPAVLVTRKGERSPLASRMVHPPVQGGGLRQSLVATDDPAILASHAITPEAHAALQSGDIDTFLRLRAKTLDPLVEDFVDRHADWGDSDRAPISQLVIGDED